MTSLETQIGGEFQSPKSGKFESNTKKETNVFVCVASFQSPRSGKFESNNYKRRVL